VKKLHRFTSKGTSELFSGPETDSTPVYFLVFMVYGIEFSTNCAYTTSDGPLFRLRKLIYCSANEAIGHTLLSSGGSGGRLGTGQAEDWMLPSFTSIFEPAASGRSKSEYGDVGCLPNIDPPPYTP
jgi:hypothetical protein